MIGRSCARCRASFLLTPLREGRRAALYAEEGAYTISTHAPAGGATINAPVPVPTFYISTHAPAGGATRGTVYRANPHGVISTHAPSGGATQPHIYTVW